MNPNIPPFFPLGVMPPFGLKEPVAGSVASCASSSDGSPTKKSTNPVLGREQAKKRLLAFAQQVNKTKEALQKDKVFKKWQDKYGPLKHTYIVDGFEGDEKSYPLAMVKFTKTEPQISYCENLTQGKGAFKSRKEVMDGADDETKKIMKSIMENVNSIPCNRFVMGRYRQWYVNPKCFIENDQVEFTALQIESERNCVLEQPGPSNRDQRFEKYSPHWETDSEEEMDLSFRRQPEPVVLPKPVEVKLISKVKINKIELPFFEDEEYLESLLAGKPKVQDDQPPKVPSYSLPERKPVQMEKLAESAWEQPYEDCEWRTKLPTRTETDKEPLKLNQSFEKHTEKTPVKESREEKLTEPECAKHPAKSDDVDIYGKVEDSWCQEESSLYDFIFDDRNKAEESTKSVEKGAEESPVLTKRQSPSPDPAENSRHHRSSRSSRSRRESSSSLTRIDEEHRPQSEEKPFIPLLDEYPASADVKDESEDARTFYHPQTADDSFSDDDTLIKAATAAVEAAAEKKRISLDERLEMELGFRVADAEQENLPPSLTPPPPVQEQTLDESCSVKMRRGFGPKAAPMGALIYSCPKALPLAPYVPPHLQNVLYRPLVRARPPPAPKVVEEDATLKEESADSPTKDWNVELRNLETIACNLEMADENVLEDLEEKLLLFEAVSMIPSSRDESPPPGQEAKIVSKPVKNKRPKPPPIELKEPGKGILIMPRFLDIEEAANKRKKVVFADSINPGDGTSSSDGEDLPPPRSPPPGPVELMSQRKKKVKRKRTKRRTPGDDFDPEYDALPPPPPPPGSPPPHLTQGNFIPSVPAVDPPILDHPPSPESSPPPPPPGDAEVDVAV